MVGGVRLASHQFIQLGQQAQDFGVQWISGQSALIALVQQLPQAAYAVGGFANLFKMAVSPISLTIAAVVGFGAAVAGVTAAVSNAQTRFKDFDHALTSAGGAAGMTAEQLHDLSDAVAGYGGVTASAARGVEESIVRTGRIGSGVLRGLTTMVADFAAVTGQDLDSAGKALAKLFEDPVKGATELQRAMNLLTEAERRHIENLSQQGRLGDAQSALMDRLAARTRGAAEQVGFLKKAWQDFLVFHDQAMKNTGVTVARVFNPSDLSNYTRTELGAEAREARERLTSPGMRSGIFESDKAGQLRDRIGALDLEIAKRDALQLQASYEQLRLEMQLLGEQAEAVARQYDPLAGRTRELTNQEILLADAIARGAGDQAVLLEGLERVRNARASLLTPTQEAVELARIEGQVLAAPISAREELRARLMAEHEMRGRAISDTERQIQIDTAATRVIQQRTAAVRDAVAAAEKDAAASAAYASAQAGAVGNPAAQAAVNVQQRIYQAIKSANSAAGADVASELAETYRLTGKLPENFRAIADSLAAEEWARFGAAVRSSQIELDRETKSLQAIAAVAGQGNAVIAQAEREQRAHAAALKAGAQGTAAFKSVYDATLTSLQAADVAKATTEWERYVAAEQLAIDAAQRLAEAQLGGAEAVAAANAENERAKALAEANYVLDEERQKQVVDFSRARQAIAARDRANGEIRQRDLQLEQDRLGVVLALETDPDRQRAVQRVVALRREELRLMEQYPGQQAEMNRLLQQYADIYDTAAIQKFYEEQRAAADDMARDLRGYFVDALTSIQEKGGSIFRGLWDGVVGMAKRAAVNVAGAFLERQIFMPVSMAIVGAMPGLFGISSPGGATGGAAASGGLGSILSPITDILGMTKSFVGSAFSGVTNFLNGTIGPALGFSAPISGLTSATAAEAIAAASGGAFGGMSLTSFLGPVGAGFGIGSLLSSLTGGSQVGGMIGSGLGSLGGAALGSMLLPGPGTLIGALLGGAGGGLLGGMFGGDENRPLGNARLGAVKNGRLTYGGDTSLDGYDNSAEIAQMRQAVDLVNGLIDKLGLTIDESLLAAGFGDARNPVGLIGKTSNFDGPANLNEWIQRFFSGRDGKSYLTGATGTLKDAFDSFATGTAKPEDGEEVLRLLEYAAQFDDAAARAAAGVDTLARQTLEWSIAAREAGKALQKSVEDYIKNATDLFGAGSTQETQAKTTQRQTIYGLMGLAPSGAVAGPDNRLTGADAEIASMTAQFQAYQGALEATGLSAADATAAINRAIAARTAEIRAIDEEAKKRTTFALGQRESAAKLMAYGRRSGVTGDQMATAALDEQHRQEVYDAKAANKSPEDIARLESIQTTEKLALKEQLLEQTRRAAEEMVDRQNAAMVALGLKTQAEADTEALLAKQRQQRWDAERSGMSDANREMLLHTQGLERQALAYQQVVQAAQEAATKQAGILQSTMSVTIAQITATASKAATEFDAFGRAIDKAAQAEQRMADVRNQAMQAIESYKDVAEVLRKAIAGIRASAKDPEAQMNAARDEFFLQLGRSRDMSLSDEDRIEAMNAAAEAGNQYRDLAKDYYGAGTGFVTAANEVAAGLDGMKTQADAQREYLKNQLKLMEKYYPSIDTSLIDIEAAISAFETARTGQTTANATANNNLKDQFIGLAGQVSTYAQQLRGQGVKEPKVEELVEEQFGGVRDQILNAITDWRVLNAIGEQYYRGMNAGTGAPEADAIRVKILSLGGTPTFARGGFHAGGLRLVGEEGAELEATGPARIWTAEQTRDFMTPRFELPRMPSLPANDTVDVTPVVRQLERLTAEFSAYRLQSSEETVALRAELADARGEQARLRKAMERLGSAPVRAAS